MNPNFPRREFQTVVITIFTIVMTIVRIWTFILLYSARHAHAGMHIEVLRDVPSIVDIPAGNKPNAVRRRLSHRH